MTTSADSDLDERIRALPQELQDFIFDFTLSPDSNRVITITSKYRAPSKSRDVAATRYDTSKIFTFVTGGNAYDEVFAFIQKWVTSLPRLHASILRELRLPMRSINEPIMMTNVSFPDGFHIRHGYLLEIRASLHRKGINLKAEVFKAQYDTQEGGREWYRLKDANDALGFPS